MAIYAPGKRDRHNRRVNSGKRSIVAMLSLTAMVDMFTVITVFLLQNYQTTGEVIEISDKVTLPKAEAVKEIKPAVVVVVSQESIMVDKDNVVTLAQVKAQDEWLIQGLATLLKDRFVELEAKGRVLGLDKIRQAVNEAKPEGQREEPENYRRVTVQADKNIDFLTIKKVMTSVAEAGASEINFAVMKEEKPAQ